MIRRFAQGTFLTLDIVVNRQDPVANTTTIDYSLHIERRNNWNDNFRGHANIYMDINGVNLNQNNVWWDISGHEQTKSSFLKSGSLTIQHEDSGSKSIGFSVTLQPNTQGFSWGDAQNIRIDGNMQLPFINVQKTSDFTMQDSVTLGATGLVILRGEGGGDVLASMPISVFILSILALSLSSQKRRGGIGYNLAIGIVLAFVFIFSFEVLKLLSAGQVLPPFLAM